jgi:hypothetical protein
MLKEVNKGGGPSLEQAVSHSEQCGSAAFLLGL